MTRSPYDPTRTFYPEPWEDQAACVGRNPDWWFSDNPYTTDTARTICAGCPVRDLCFEKGRNEEFGMFGGLTGKERRALAAPKPRVDGGREATIRRLHSEGHSDRQIAAMIGLNSTSVGDIRHSMGLDPVVKSGRRRATA